MLRTVAHPLRAAMARSASATAARAEAGGEPHPMYLDGAATTRVDPRVLDAMLPFMTEDFGNSGSRTHAYGWVAEDAVEAAREQVAGLIGAAAKDVVFTSGATESNNIAVKGVARFYKKTKRHVITTQVEHKCVLDSCRALEQEGFDVTYLPVSNDGLVDIDTLKAALRPDTSLVSVMAVNNETGVLQPIADIGKVVREAGAKFHVDAAQAVGKLPFLVDDQNVDLVSISGHKMYGPKGVGALYVRRRPRVRLEAVFSGGGQERGIRSGTVPVDLAVGLGAAAQLCAEEMEYDSAHVARLSARLTSGLMDAIPEVIINGSAHARYPGIMNYSFAYVEGESLLMGLKDIAISSGSACTSASLEPSYVLRALGVGEDLAHSSLRFGIGRFTTDAEVDDTIRQTIAVVERLRELSPLYEMVQEGIDLSTIKWSEH